MHSQLLATETQHGPHQSFLLSLNYKSRKSLLTLSTLSINLITEIICGISLLQCKELEQWADSLGIQYQRHTMLSLSSGQKLGFHQALDEKVLRQHSVCVSTLETNRIRFTANSSLFLKHVFLVCKIKIQVEYFKILSMASVNWDPFTTGVCIRYPYFSLQD